MKNKSKNCTHKRKLIFVPSSNFWCSLQLVKTNQKIFYSYELAIVNRTISGLKEFRFSSLLLTLYLVNCILITCFGKKVICIVCAFIHTAVSINAVQKETLIVFNFLLFSKIIYILNVFIFSLFYN